MSLKSIIEELRNDGMSQEAIAAACRAKGVSCRQTTISALERGESLDARYSLGKALEQLQVERRAASAKPDDEGGETARGEQGS
jgi:transcriptional regulator with XRE-family HTH domain